MQILVTGGAGYIGSVIVCKLLKANYEVIVIDNLEHSVKDHLPDAVKFYIGDIGDENILNEIFSQNTITHVIHCASYIDVNESMTNPMKYFDNNIGKFIKLLNVMETNACRNIIFSSTCATYGIPVSVPLTEDNPQNPINIYGWTKLICEQMLDHVGKIHNFNVVILRYFNVAGAYINGDTIIGENHNPETHLIPLAIKALLSDKSFNIYGTDHDTPDGTCIRDYIHVEDLADAHILALGQQGKFNLGTEFGHSVKEIIELIEKNGKKELIINYCDKREGDPPILYANSSKFKLKFRWEPIHNITSIINSAFKWHIKSEI